MPDPTPSLPSRSHGRPGAFFVIEGPDGVGKTSTVRQLCPLIEEAVGRSLQLVREPGGTQLGERIRSLIMDPTLPDDRDGRVDLMLFSATRRVLLDRVVEPALEAGRVVVSDRFALSTYAYQGGAQGVDLEDIDDVTRVAVGGCWPDTTVLLTLPPDEWRERLAGRDEDRTRFEDEATLAAAQEEYRALAERLPRTVEVSARGTPGAVARRVFQEAIEPVLVRRGILPEPATSGRRVG